jgi:hypothetical protein
MIESSGFFFFERSWWEKSFKLESIQNLQPYSGLCRFDFTPELFDQKMSFF